MTSTTWIPYTITTGYTNLGSLNPTSFPSDCLQSLWNFQTFPLIQGDTAYENTQGCAISTCCPSGHFYTDNGAWMTSYYSPGVCPSQYRSCPPPPETAPTVLSSQSGETVVFCCPTNYGCPYTINPEGFWYCQSIMTSSTTSIVIMDNIFDQSTVSTSLWTKYSTFSGVYVAAYPIQIRIGTSSMSTTGSVVNHTTASNSSSSLSGGAIAGIVIGTLIGVALVIAGVLILMYRYKRKSHKQPSAVALTDIGEASTFGYKAELDSQIVFSTAQPNHTISELDSGTGHIAELPVNSYR